MDILQNILQHFWEEYCSWALYFYFFVYFYIHWLDYFNKPISPPVVWSFPCFSSGNTALGCHPGMTMVSFWLAVNVSFPALNQLLISTNCMLIALLFWTVPLQCLLNCSTNRCNQNQAPLKRYFPVSVWNFFWPQAGFFCLFPFFPVKLASV